MTIVAVVIVVVWMVSTEGRKWWEVGVGKQQKEAERKERKEREAAEREERTAGMEGERSREVRKKPGAVGSGAPKTPWRGV